jgi:hypothetical protein
LFKDLTVAPGEVKNLCDLRIVAENRDGQE